MFAVVWLFCFVSAAVQISTTAKFEKRLKHTQNKDCIHVVGFSDLIYLWVIIRYLKKKPTILCARSTLRCTVHCIKRRSCCQSKWKLYSIAKITRLYDYQTWKTHFWRNSQCAQRFVGFFLACAFKMLIGWTGKLITWIQCQTKTSSRACKGSELWISLIWGVQYRWSLHMFSLLPRNMAV